MGTGHIQKKGRQEWGEEKGRSGVESYRKKHIAGRGRWEKDTV